MLRLNSRKRKPFITVLAAMLSFAFSFSAMGDRAVPDAGGRPPKKAVVQGEIRFSPILHSISVIKSREEYTDATFNVPVIEVSAGIRILEKIVVETGGDISDYFFEAFDDDENEYSIYRIFSRVGFMPVLYDRRGHTHRGPVLQLGGKLGYHYFYNRWREGDSGKNRMFCKMHGLSLGVAGDYTHWYAQHIGLIMGLSLDGGAALFSVFSDDWKLHHGKPGFFFSAVFSLGVAF